VASQPPRITWTNEARSIFEKLPYAARNEIVQKIEILRLHPRMYQVEQGGRWAGLRRFLVRQWKVFYDYWDSEHTIYIETIAHARANDPSLE